VTQACGLSHEIRIAADIPAKRDGGRRRDPQQQVELHTLELTSGRMAKLARGDVVSAH